MTGPQENKAVDSYQSYLQYKKLLEFLELGTEITFTDMAQLLDTTVPRSKYIIQVLLEYKIVKLSKFSLEKGKRQHVYKLA